MSTNKQMIELSHALAPLLTRSDMPSKFSYAVMRNVKKMGDVVAAFEELKKPSPELDKYEASRVAICEEFADKELDAEGHLTDKFLIEKNQYVFQPEAKEAMVAKLEELRAGEDYKKAVVIAKTKDKEMADLLDEECDIELHKVSSDYLPDNLSPTSLLVMEAMLS